MKDIIEINKLINYLSIYNEYQFDENFKYTISKLEDIDNINEIIDNIDKYYELLIEIFVHFNEDKLKIEILFIIHLSKYQNKDVFFKKSLNDDSNIVSFFAIWCFYKSENLKATPTFMNIFYSIEKNNEKENIKLLLIYIASIINDSIAIPIIKKYIENKKYRFLILKYLEGDKYSEISEYIIGNLNMYSKDLLSDAILALGKINKNISEDIFIEYLNNTSFVVVKSSIKTLSIIGTKKSLFVIVEKISNGEINYDSIKNSLIDLGNRCKHDLSIYFTKELNEENQLIFIELVGDMKYKAIAKDLLFLLEKEKDDIIIVEEILIALKKIGSREVIPLFLEDLSKNLSDSNIYFVETIINLLVKIKDSRTVLKLVEILETSNKFLVVRAIEALGKISDPLFLEPIFIVLRKNSDYQEVVEKALSNFGEGSEELLIEYLFDQNDSVKLVIAKTLRRFHHKIVERPLMLTLEDSKSQLVRSACARSLGDVKSRVSVDTLLENLGGSFELVESIIYALGKIKEISTIDIIIKHLTHESKSIIIEAIIALENFEDTKAIIPLLKTKKQSTHNNEIINLVDNAILKINKANLK